VLQPVLGLKARSAMSVAPSAGEVRRTRSANMLQIRRFLSAATAGGTKVPASLGPTGNRRVAVRPPNRPDGRMSPSGALQTPPDALARALRLL
jgi:hypothetical protein